MDTTERRGLVFYSLISLVALLWAGFLAQQGAMLWISLLLTITVLGVSVILFIFLLIQMRSEEREAQSG